jgi:hypothetical protein
MQLKKLAARRGLFLCMLRRSTYILGHARAGSSSAAAMLAGKYAEPYLSKLAKFF